MAYDLKQVYTNIKSKISGNHVKLTGNRGFTLVEIMVVIAIIGILSAIAIPNYITWRNNSMASGAARNLKGDLDLARFRAIRDNTTVTVNINPANSNYTITTGGGVQLRNRQLTAVNVVTTLAGDSTVFFSNGRSSNQGTITMTNLTGDRTSTITVQLVGPTHIQ